MHTAIDDEGIFTKEQIDDIARTVAGAAREVCGDRLRGVALFGSYARGDFHDYSDVDMAILADADDISCNEIESKMLDALFSLEDFPYYMLSVIAIPYERFERMKSGYPFYRSIECEGIRYA